MSNSRLRIVIILASVTLVAAGLGYVWNKKSSEVFDWGSEPVIRIQPASEESLHVEYPTVFTAADTNIMLYSSYGDDRRWRIKLAVADNETNYVKQGNIFDESTLPFKGSYAFPFVRKVSVEGSTLFELYFSVTEDGASSYSAIYRSASRNGLSWGQPKKLIGDNALDPIVLKQSGQDVILYTYFNGDDNSIKLSPLNADGSVGLLRTVFKPDNGIYTLGVVHVSTVPVVIVETQKSWEALCFNASGVLIKASQEPVIKQKENLNKAWDGLKYGMYFFEEATPPAIYYNGIEAHGAESGGQIGAGTYDLVNLASKLNLTECH
ncbi:hypothetical protein K5D56_18305 [Pseudomonas cichorii]|nr:hypothetical protein [Pseudomonas cichorii]MBX8547365.1 hypothetical protein [Pseudomonas cichorii]MBX8561085.1 hypothetical protein [Pseudomonas cichorii]MBX8579359.1 hypothetical protein [Pseudomonas cichorii]MBX8591316.1 hypothetical protein [Pseudomonas cichorii]